MITISNGWMNNSVSYSRISEIASAAQRHALQRSAGAEVSDHSRDMEFGEKLYDYLFCGSVKKEFMDYLYQMSHDRKVEGIRMTTGRAHRRESIEQASNFGRRVVNEETRGTKWKLKELMSGNSLHFGPWSIETEKNNADYLIYRNDSQRTTVGIPLKLPKPSSHPKLNDLIATSTPTFHSAADIQLRHLKPIMKRQRLILGGQTFQIRCTKNNEPVVLLSDDIQQSEVLQKKLQNLQTIGNVKQRFIKLINTPMADTTTEISTNVYETHLSEKRVQELDILRQKVVGIQIKFDKAVEHLHSRLNDEASLLCGELDRFERAADYTFADNRDFLLFKGKLRLLEHARWEANKLIEFIKKTLNDAYFSLFLHSTLDQLDTRIVMVTNEIFKLLRSKLDGRKIDHIKNFCHTQSKFISAFSPLKLSHFFVWPYRRPDQPQAANPKIYQEHFDQLRDLANDPSCTWVQFKSAKGRLKRERDSHIHDIYIEDMNWI